MRAWARGPRWLSTAATSASTAAVAPTSESKGPIVSTLVTSTWLAQLEAGDSHGSVKRTTWQPWAAATRALSIVSAW